MKQTPAILLLLAIVTGCASTAPMPLLTDMAGLYFPEEGEAIRRGAVLAKDIDAGRVPKWQPGTKVCLLGSIAGTGATPDIHPAVQSERGTYFGSLLVLTNTTVSVKITTGEDVRPPAVGWGAVLLGTLESVDTKEKTISVTVMPENWKLTEAW